MATFNFFNSFTEAEAEKKHNLGSDTLTIALTNSAPSVSNSVLADITQISYTNLSSRTLTTTSSAQTSGDYKLIIADKSLTASGGSVATFRYVVIYNDTAANDELIGWYDTGAAQSLADGDQFNINFDDTNGLIQKNV
jgi:hypothetical protein